MRTGGGLRPRGTFSCFGSQKGGQNITRSYEKRPSSIPDHPCDWYIFLHRLTFMENVGKYTIYHTGILYGNGSCATNTLFDSGGYVFVYKHVIFETHPSRWWGLEVYASQYTVEFKVVV